MRLNGKCKYSKIIKYFQLIKIYNFIFYQAGSHRLNLTGKFGRILDIVLDSLPQQGLHQDQIEVNCEFSNKVTKLYLYSLHRELKVFLVSCLCDDLDDDDLDIYCEDLEEDLRDVSRRKMFTVLTVSPPPPYENPPSYDVAVSKELEFLYSHV